MSGRGRVFLRSPTGEVARVLELTMTDAFPTLVIDADAGPG
jgi:hypothetical protein